MSQARNTILAVGISALAAGGFLAWSLACKHEPPASPMVAETAQEKADNVQDAFARGAAVIVAFGFGYTHLRARL